MKYQRNLAFVLLTSLFLQNCGVSELEPMADEEHSLKGKFAVNPEASKAQRPDKPLWGTKAQHTSSTAVSSSSHQSYATFQSMTQVRIGLQAESALTRRAALPALPTLGEKGADVRVV